MMSQDMKKTTPPHEDHPLMPEQNQYHSSQGGYPPQSGYAPPQGGAPDYPPPYTPTTQQPAAYPQPQHNPFPPPQQYPYQPPQLQGGYPPPQPGYPVRQPQSNLIYQPGVSMPMSGILINASHSAPPTANWMVRPGNVPNCPPGLEFLTCIDQLFVHQQFELLEVLSNVEIENKYVIHNKLGEMVYFAAEESDMCLRNCIGAARPFNIRLTDKDGQQAIMLSRPCACQCCCSPCCLQKMEVFSPPGVLAGTVEECCNLFFPSFVIKNPSGDDMLKIKGPFCPACRCSDVKFEIFTADGEIPIGKIIKKWMGLAIESYSNVDNFDITFPLDLDVRTKALLLSSVFLIDMMYFEQRKRRNR